MAEVTIRQLADKLETDKRVIYEKLDVMQGVMEALRSYVIAMNRKLDEHQAEMRQLRRQDIAIRESLARAAKPV